MSSVAVCRYKLANTVGVTALVPATRIMAGVLPQATVMPAIALTQVSGAELLGVGSAMRHHTDRVQVTAFATTYPALQSILTAALAALKYSRGTINSINCDSILPDVIGPDGFDDVLGVHFKSQDFIVKWNE